MYVKLQAKLTVKEKRCVTTLITAVKETRAACACTKSDWQFKHIIKFPNLKEGLRVCPLTGLKAKQNQLLWLPVNINQHSLNTSHFGITLTLFK